MTSSLLPPPPPNLQLLPPPGVMMQLHAPPPLPPHPMGGLPPPPPPTGGPPPPPPLMVGGLLPPPPQRGPQQQPMPGFPPRSTLSKTVLLTKLPTILQDKNRLRTWLVELTGVRHIVLSPPRQQQPPGSSSSTNQKMKDLFSLLKTCEEGEPTDYHALVTCTHAEGAMKMVSVLRQFWEGQESAAHWVPVQPNRPLPPPTSFSDYSASLVENLSKTLSTCLENLSSSSSSSKDRDNKDRDSSNHRPAQPLSQNNATTTTTATEGYSSDKMDQGDDAGGDGEENPLLNPAVLEAVQNFRQSLEKQQGHKAIRRKELVMEKLELALERLRRNPPPIRPTSETGGPPPRGGGGGGETLVGGMLSPPPLQYQQQHQQQQQQHLLPAPPGLLPPPPPPMGGPPPPMHDLPPPPMPSGFPPPPMQSAGVPPPPPPAFAGPRGRSNLPAWMTQQQPPEPQQQQQIQEEPPNKRLKIDLKEWISKEIQQLLGEPEATLVNFIYQHAMDPSKNLQDLLPELQEVLDEDATGFLEQLKQQVNP